MLRKMGGAKLTNFINFAFVKLAFRPRILGSHFQTVEICGKTKTKGLKHKGLRPTVVQ